jgi:hypothetical protein
MDDLSFYCILTDPKNKLTEKTVSALIDLLHRVEKLEGAQNTEQANPASGNAKE